MVVLSMYDRKINILYICDEYPPCQHGGIGTVTKILANALSQKANKVVVAGFYPYFRRAPERENDSGVEVFRFFYGNKWKLQFSRRKVTGRLINIKKDFKKYTEKVFRLIKDYNIDIVEIPDFNEAFRYSGPKMISFPDFGIPTIIKCHGSYSFLDHLDKKRDLRKTIYEKEVKLINSATRLIAVSNFIKGNVIEIYKYKKEIEVISNGLPVSNSSTYKENAEIKTVVFTGTLSENKGIFSLIKAWMIVLNKVSSARLLVFGKSSSSTRSELNKLIPDNRTSSIEFKGFIKKEELFDIYCNCSCAIFPSYSESFGMAPIEAMSVGCPTIFTRRATGPEIIDEGIDGLLVDPDNIQEIADSILFMLTNRQKAVEMGQNAINKVNAKFDINLIADQHLKYYNDILKRQIIKN
jgi:glycogen synthase